MGIAGISYGLGVGFLGAILAGAGHGWGTGVWSGLSVFVAPLHGIATVYRDRASGRVLLALAAVGVLAIDSLLLYFAWNEGSHYLFRLWSAPGGLAGWLLWLFLWLAWHATLLAVAVWGRKWALSWSQRYDRSEERRGG